MARKPTKKQLYKRAQWVRLDDDIPRVGSGLRPVVVKSIGPKWVRLLIPATGSGVRIPRRKWEAITRAKNNRATA
jgi:hypothetical protein